MSLIDRISAKWTFNGIMRLVFLVFSVAYGALHIYWSDKFEWFQGADELDNLLFVLTTGYIVSLLFYILYVYMPNFEKRKRRRTIATALFSRIVFSGQEIDSALQINKGFDGCSFKFILDKMDIIKSQQVFYMSIYSNSGITEGRNIAIDEYIYRLCRSVHTICDKYFYLVGDEFPLLIGNIVQCSEGANDLIHEYNENKCGNSAKFSEWYQKLPFFFSNLQELVMRAKDELGWTIDTSKKKMMFNHHAIG